MINGTEYSYESIEITLNGKLIAATGIKYSTKRDVQQKYILGQSNAAAVVKGAKASEGELMIEHNELIRLQSAIPKGSDLTDISGVTIIVKYQNDNNMIYTDTLTGCVFTEQSKEFKAENPNFEYTLPMTIGKIIYQK
jgi:hypothetical protein